jgi:hypothetical protein
LKERRENGPKMAEYVTLENSTYEKVIAEPYTRIQGKPTWLQTTQLIAELEAQAMMFDVSYDWAGDNGLLAVIEGAAKYLARTGENYIEPVRPGAQHPNILNGTAAQIRAMDAENDGWRRDYAIFSGFCRGCGHNVRDALDSKYYEQLREETFIYKRVRPKDYIDELKSKWVFLDEIQAEALITNYKRGWEEGEHIAAFAKRLDREQVKLDADGIIISTVDKNRHYNLEMWKSKRFPEATMTKWTSKPPARRTYDKSVKYFEKKMAAIDKYEAATGGSGKPNEFAGATTEIKAQLSRAIEVIQENDEEHALAMREAKSDAQAMKEQIRSLANLIGTLSEKIEANKHRSTRRTKRKTVTPPESSEDESESEAEESTPPRKKRKDKKKEKNKKKKEKMYKPDGEYKPGMEVDVTLPKEEKLKFFKARRAYWDTDTKEANADEVRSLKVRQELGRKRRKNKE